MIFRLWCEEKNCYHTSGNRPYTYKWGDDIEKDLWDAFVNGVQWDWVFDSPLIIELDLSKVPKRPWVKRRPKP